MPQATPTPSPSPTPAPSGGWPKTGTEVVNYVVSRFRTEAVAAHVELQKGERSELAELAANIL